MAATEKQKQSLYFPEDTLREIMTQANRLDRSLSWTVQQAWRLAREGLRSSRWWTGTAKRAASQWSPPCASGRPPRRMPPPLICVGLRLRSASSSGESSTAS